MRICVDFDGVVHNPNDKDEGYKMGKPIEGARDAILKLKNEGNEIIIFTVRGGTPHYVAEWMNFFNIPFDEITNIKPDDVAFFIDDHGLRFEGDWTKTLEDINKYNKEYHGATRQLYDR